MIGKISNAMPFKGKVYVMCHNDQIEVTKDNKPIDRYGVKDREELFTGKTVGDKDINYISNQGLCSFYIDTDRIYGVGDTGIFVSSDDGRVKMGIKYSHNNDYNKEPDPLKQLLATSAIHYATQCDKTTGLYLRA